jgi:hypothetical protein
MEPFRFGSVDDLSSSIYAREAVPCSLPRTLVKRLAKEYADLSRSLPVSAGSSVLVRHQESALHQAQMLVLAPEGTPYARGCFLFDVFFPPDYPAVPPRVNLATTGAGTVRFKYACPAPPPRVAHDDISSVHLIRAISNDSNWP